MKHYIKLALSAIITCSISYAENLKICQSEEDKTQGCLERIYTHGYVDMCLDCAYYEFPYKNGKIEGIAKAYSDKKLLVGTYPYKNGKLDGIANYYANGNLIRETPYKNGKEDGIEKKYYPNGNLMQETSYKDGKQDGIEKRYDENGDLFVVITYKNEKIISGKCGDGKQFSNAHLHKLEDCVDSYGCPIDFIIEEICEKP